MQVWRGGASIFMRGLLKAHGVRDRIVHLVDSFNGLPSNSTANDMDLWSKMVYLRVPQVRTPPCGSDRPSPVQRHCNKVAVLV
jgi:hypothetical protein